MKIEKVEWFGYQAVEMEAGGYSALMVPAVGANMVKLAVESKGVDILRTPDKETIANFAERPQLFGLPLLFPPNRIEDGTYTHGGVKYNFPITIPAQNNYHHGIIKSQQFTVTKTLIGGDFVEVEASFFSNRFNDEIYRDFPHEFECRMYFKLSEKGLLHRVTFINLGDKPMPLGVGYHTPVMVPFVKGGKAEDYRIRLSAGEKWELTDRNLPTGKFLPLEGDEQLMRTTGMRPTGKAVEIALTARPIEVDGRSYNGAVITDTARNLSVYYEVGDEYKDWTFWNNGGGVEWACPEPQTWAINAPNIKLPDDVTGFRTLDPGKEWSAESKLYIK